MRRRCCEPVTSNREMAAALGELVSATIRREEDWMLFETGDGGERDARVLARAAAHYAIAAAEEDR